MRQKQRGVTFLGLVVVAGVGTVNASARVRGIGVSGVVSAPLGQVSLFAKAGIRTSSSSTAAIAANLTFLRPAPLFAPPFRRRATKVSAVPVWPRRMLPVPPPF